MTKRISELPAGAVPGPTDLVEIETAGGASVYATAAQLALAIATDPVYSNLFVSTTGDQMTGPLSIKSGGAKLELWQSTTVDADTGRWQMVVDDVGADHAGRVIFRLQADDGNRIGEPIVVHADGSIVLGATPNPLATPAVYVPAATGAGQAAQVTAFDAATGRLAVGGHEVGDTGPRDLRSTLQNGWSALTFSARRIGPVVHVLVRGLTDGTVNSCHDFSVIGSPASGSIFTMADATNVGPVVELNRVLVQGSGQFTASAAATVEMYGAMTWTTSDPWPAVLPGVAM